MPSRFTIALIVSWFFPNTKFLRELSGTMTCFVMILVLLACFLYSCCFLWFWFVWAYTPWFLGRSYNFLPRTQIVERIGIQRTCPSTHWRGKLIIKRLWWFVSLVIKSLYKSGSSYGNICWFKLDKCSCSLTWRRCIARIIRSRLWGEGYFFPPTLLVFTFKAGSDVVFTSRRVIDGLWRKNECRRLCLPDLQLCWL